MAGHYPFLRATCHVLFLLLLLLLLPSSLSLLLQKLWNAVICLGRFPGLQTMPIQMGNASAGRPHPRIPDITTILTQAANLLSESAQTQTMDC